MTAFIRRILYYRLTYYFRKTTIMTIKNDKYEF